MATAAERLRLLMVDPDKAALEAIVADELSYGHSAATNDNGKPGAVTIKILQVWQQQQGGGQWRLIARQAVRPPV